MEEVGEVKFVGTGWLGAQDRVQSIRPHTHAPDPSHAIARHKTRRRHWRLSAPGSSSWTPLPSGPRRPDWLPAAVQGFVTDVRRLQMRGLHPKQEHRPTNTILLPPDTSWASASLAALYRTV
jgi:hypothetical protein